MVLNKDRMYQTLDEWNNKTFGEAFGEIEITEENEDSVKLLKKVLMHQGLMDKPMNGLASEGLKKTEVERLGVKYVDFLNALETSGEYWTPLDMLHDIFNIQFVNFIFIQYAIRISIRIIHNEFYEVFSIPSKMTNIIIIIRRSQNF